MEILERYKTWIHTHFVTDCVRLPAHRIREIQQGITPVLRRLGIVYGIHFESLISEKTIRIVLECLPLREDLQVIEAELKSIIKTIPARPVPTEAIRAEEPPSPKRRI
ncbi:MAG: hypothetical protein HYY65_04340 [Candidatus Tectomicrobia bacterium]|uniref:Uncharacterized protein n=1 Tax=Tectimicrobiota bacterium TaxID=2528274 RepID=A0A932GP28_UNCTE|nr:hypothetical protein [Candidatus Tectomicrobia bacterium]